MRLVPKSQKMNSILEDIDCFNLENGLDDIFDRSYYSVPSNLSKSNKKQNFSKRVKILGNAFFSSLYIKNK